MNVTVADLTVHNYFTQDVFYNESMFLYPKNLVFTDDILDILDKWGIAEVSSEGELQELTQQETNTQAESGENVGNAEEKSDVISPNAPNKPAEPQINSKVPYDFSQPYPDVYKRWALKVMVFFKDILTSQSVNKEDVLGLLDEMESRVKHNQNDAMMVIGKPMDGVSSIYRKALDVTVLSLLLAETLKFNDFAKGNLLIASLFHDIGMLKIPKQILSKKGALTPQEISLVRSHTIIGYKYLKSVNYSSIICSGALQHHERIDGKGYPNQVPSDKITDISKVISVADAYCAAIADKVFKESLHGKDAVQDLLSKGGTVYDPVVLKALVKTISFYPVGSLVQLSNNVPAKVIGTTQVAMRPIVRTIIFEDTSSKPGEIIDLSKTPSLFITGIYKR